MRNHALLVLAAGAMTMPAAGQSAGVPRCAVVDVPARSADAGVPAGGTIEAIYALLDAWREALAAGDGAAVTALVTDSAKFWSQGAPSIKGRARTCCCAI
jgi:hypothetical protein